MPERFLTEDEGASPPRRQGTRPGPGPVSVPRHPMSMPPSSLDDTPLLEEQATREDDRLTQAAETIGHAVGTAVSTVNHAVEGARELPHNMRSRLTLIRGRGRQAGRKAERIREEAAESLEEAGERAMRLAQEAGDRTADLAEQASERAGAALHDIREQVEAGYDEARRRTEAEASRLRSWALQTADQQPLYVIAAAAGTGFVLGLLLRLGRSKDD